MNKKFLLLSLAVVAAASCLIFFRLKNNDSKLPAEERYVTLLPRKAALSYPAEWTTLKNNADILLKKIQQKPSDLKSQLSLIGIYIQEARNTGNFNYYNAVALKCLDRILMQDNKNFEALTFKATILLSQHKFAEGLAMADQVKQMYPYNAYVYGLLVDANVELGNYTAAVEAADQMVSIRPDIRSYSRIAYLREIHGDIPGAIEAMKLAVDAGAPGAENTEWCRVQLGKLHEQLGSEKDAELYYAMASASRDNYPYALAGLARIAKSKKNYAEAISLFQRADSLIPDHTFKEGIAEIYTLTGQKEKATAITNDILKTLPPNDDHEMAHAYMGLGEFDKALEYAMIEYKRRPANIEVNETVAMVMSRKGDYEKALPYIEAAMKTHCQNPELLDLAELIYSKTNKKF